MRRLPRRRRGITLLETMVTATVLVLGIAVVASTVVAITRLNRRNLAQSQAYTVAEWWLERVTRIGCVAGADAGTACNTLKAMDGKDYTVYWNASGPPSTTPPTGKDVVRPYLVSIDVDPPFEGTELGDPSLNGRTVAGVPIKETVNIRVTVSWQDEVSKQSYHAVALQTRVGP